jgi:hypothetical protein
MRSIGYMYSIQVAQNQAPGKSRLTMDLGNSLLYFFRREPRRYYVSDSATYSCTPQELRHAEWLDTAT